MGVGNARRLSLFHNPSGGPAALDSQRDRLALRPPSRANSSRFHLLRPRRDEQSYRAACRSGTPCRRCSTTASLRAAGTRPLHAALLGDLHLPGPQQRPLAAARWQVASQQPVAALRDARSSVGPARLIAPWRQAEMGPYRSWTWTTLRDDCGEPTPTMFSHADRNSRLARPKPGRPTRLEPPGDLARRRARRMTEAA